MEVMAVIAIIGIMTGVGVRSLQDSKADAKLKSAQREIASAIKLAQTYALQGKVVSSLGKAPCAYGFKFSSATSYEIFYSSDCASTSSLESYNLDGVSLSSPEASGSVVTFSLPFATMTSGKDLTLTLNFSDISKDVIIHEGGYVEEK